MFKFMLLSKVPRHLPQSGSLLSERKTLPTGKRRLAITSCDEYVFARHQKLKKFWGCIWYLLN